MREALELLTRQALIMKAHLKEGLYFYFFKVDSMLSVGLGLKTLR